jgi:hypothetical protein
VQETDANTFMMTFSKQLTTLKLPIKTGFVEWVCGFDCQLSTLTIDRGNIQTALETISRFPQYTFLKELSIITRTKFDPTPLKGLNHLNKLHIFGASVLRSCPDNLTSLTMDHVRRKDKFPVDHTFGLQELKIYSRSLPKQFGLFLSKCCPRLHSLTLNRCLKAGDFLNISDLSLSYLEIRLPIQSTRTSLGATIHRIPKHCFLWSRPKPSYFITLTNALILMERKSLVDKISILYSIKPLFLSSLQTYPK